jgi:DNA-binding CsgD family transcriptional regulator
MDTLTLREMQILRLVGDYSLSGVGRILGMDVKTVKSHLHTGIYPKLGVHSKTQAAVWAWKQGLIR